MDIIWTGILNLRSWNVKDGNHIYCVSNVSGPFKCINYDASLVPLGKEPPLL